MSQVNPCSFVRDSKNKKRLAVFFGWEGWCVLLNPTDDGSGAWRAKQPGACVYHSHARMSRSTGLVPSDDLSLMEGKLVSMFEEQAEHVPCRTRRVPRTSS